MGEIAPGAHDMKREYKVLSRLWRHFDRAPRAYLFCDDPAVLGADFFVMERRRGEVVREGIPESMRAHPEVGRRIAFALVDAMADLHALDPAACGPRRPRPARGLRRAPGLRLGQAMGALAIRRLARRRWRRSTGVSSRRMPATSRASIVHNDLKLDNCQFDPADPDRVVVHLRLGHDDARRPAHRPRDPAQLLARSRGHGGDGARDAAGPGPDGPAVARGDRRALRRAERRGRGGCSAGGRRSRSGRRWWWSSSSTGAGCAARARTRAWRGSPTACRP